MDHVAPAGQLIEKKSFAMIEQQVGPHSYDPLQWPLVRRLIHSSGDFEFNGLTRFHPQAMEAGATALAAGGTLLVDVRMIQAGLSPARLERRGTQTYQFMDDPEAAIRATAQGTTKSVQAMRLAWERGVLDGAVVGIGNAPTALLEILRLMAEEGARPSLVVGMPVGFISAAESKAALASQSTVPWIITHGTKGGSTLVVAAIHALLDTAHALYPQP